MVRVPVFPEHNTFILPKFSIEVRRLTTTFCCAIRLAPWERLTLMMAGNSCGVRPTANAMENRKDSRTGRSKYTFTANIENTSSSVTSSNRYPNRRTPRSNSVSGARTCIRWAMRPNSVSLPTATITARACPLTTWVPRNRLFVRFCKGTASVSVPVDFSAG